MDYVLDFADAHFWTPYVYPATVPEDNIYRQFTSLFLMTCVGATLLYFLMATTSYYLLFDHNLRKHKFFLENQEMREIATTLQGVPGMAFLTTICFVLEVRGYSKLYDNYTDHGGIPFMVLSFIAFLLFTDMCIYWIHRGLHSKLLYVRLHKLHHLWKIPTPFASHAFHWLDGFAQSSPYHLYVMLFPMHKGLYLGLFVFVNLWSVLIHDGDYRVPKALRDVVNGSAHHTDHHTLQVYNYGQYTTFWDRLGGSYNHPTAFTGTGIHDDIKKMKERKEGDDEDKSIKSSAVITNGNGAAHKRR